MAAAEGAATDLNRFLREIKDCLFDIPLLLFVCSQHWLGSNVHEGKAAGHSLVNRDAYARRALNDETLFICTKDYERQLTPSEVLLIVQALICRDQYLKTSALSRRDQGSIGHSCPALVGRRYNYVIRQHETKLLGQVFVQQDSFLHVMGVLRHCAR